MNKTTRRRLLGSGIRSVAGLALGGLALRHRTGHGQPADGAATAAISVTSLGDNLSMLTDGRTNMLVRTGGDGVVLFDGCAAAAADSVMARIAEVAGGAPVTTLLNSHWHPEHTGLNERLGREGARIIAQENTRQWLSTDITYPWDGQHFEPLPLVAQPNDTFYEEGELGADIAYGYLRHAAHTDGDMYAHFREANVLAVGDAVYGAGWPLVDWWTGGWIGGLVGTMELVLALSDSATRIVPARGPLLGRADIEEQYEMYNVIYERLARLLNSGRGPAEAVAARPTEEFDARMGPSEAFVRRAFESLWAYLSPDA